MSGDNSSVVNATLLTNGTVQDDNIFTAEYVQFNYIMVGVSFGLLLIIIIIAKVLCVCNQEQHYDKVDLSNALRLKDDEMMAPNLVHCPPYNGNHRNYSGSNHVPGEISDEEDPEDQPSARGSVWHTPVRAPPPQGAGGHYSSQRSVILGVDSHVTSALAPARPVLSHSHTTTTPLTPTTATDTPPPEAEASHLLRHLEAVMDDDGGRPNGGAPSLSPRQDSRRFARSNSDASRSAPSGESKHYLVDIT